MYLQITLQGLLIGVSIAAPVGPIGILCIRRTLAEGRRAGFVTGLGAATADAFYGAIAAFGLTFISAFLVNQSFCLRLGGGIFLIYLGLRTFFSVPSVNDFLDSTSSKKFSMLRYYASTLVLTLTNPLTILSFAAIFAGFGIGIDNSDNYLTAWSMVVGIFLGSCLWWFFLSAISGYFRNKIDGKSMIWINRISGTIIFGFGLLSFISILILNPI